MRFWLNIGHLQFDLLLGGSVEQVIGKLIHCDEAGITILRENDGTYHGYALGVIQHIAQAP